DPVKKKRTWKTLVVDLVLLVVIVGLVVGGVHFYRTLRDLYAPVWETREVVFCVRMDGIEPSMVKYGQDGRYTFTDKPIWSSDRTDADCLGTVTDVQTVLVSRDDGYNTVTMYLTVEAQAYYREGKGYRMGATMLLAGSEGVFRVEGMAAEGVIISMHEKNTETETVTEGGAVTAEPPEIDPDAQG
ncbi:MAG: DUF4330 family protein, partial [Clostridia bacterium]|nr:DUF4330 family protein [Clostridia bacterium]